MNHRDGDGRSYWTAAELREHPLFPEALRRALLDALTATWDGEYHPDLRDFVVRAERLARDRMEAYQAARERIEGVLK